MRLRIFTLTLALLLIACKPEPEVIETVEEPSETIEGTATTIPPLGLTSTPTPTSVATDTPEPTSSSTVEVFSIDSQASEIDNMVMVYVPEGPFEMGSDDGWDSERPVHQVYLNAFWIDQTEVTNAQYALCVADGGCGAPGSEKSFSRDSYYGNPDYAFYPVIYVSWYDATAYCEWAGRRLPSEAEWEKAARNGESYTYTWGEGIDCTKANYIECVGDTTMVGSYPESASPYGLLDMAGNVWEWVSDWYDALYYGNSPLDYPKGPDSGAYRVVRGGSWNDYEWYLRSSSRYSYYPDNKRVSVGFRCALDVVQ